MDIFITTSLINTVNLCPWYNVKFTREKCSKGFWGSWFLCSGSVFSITTTPPRCNEMWSIFWAVLVVRGEFTPFFKIFPFEFVEVSNLSQPSSLYLLQCPRRLDTDTFNWRLFPYFSYFGFLFKSRLLSQVTSRPRWVLSNNFCKKGSDGMKRAINLIQIVAGWF